MVKKKGREIPWQKNKIKKNAVLMMAMVADIAGSLLWDIMGISFSHQLPAPGYEERAGRLDLTESRDKDDGCYFCPSLVAHPRPFFLSSCFLVSISFHFLFFFSFCYRFITPHFVIAVVVTLN